MAEQTAISWCDATFNPWVGCSKISPGCAHCYAETLVTGRMGRPGTWGDEGTRERTSPGLWSKPLRWAKLAREGKLPDGTPNLDGHRTRVFCASLADVFEPRIELVPWRLDLFRLIEATPELDWLLLTKRPEMARDWIMARVRSGRADWNPIPNLWMGVSVENSRFTWRADVLREIPAAVRFLSCEPLLGSLFDVRLRTKSGRVLTDEDFEALADEAERGYDVSQFRERARVSHGVEDEQSEGGSLADPTVLANVPDRDGAQSGPEAPRARGPLDLTGIDWVIVGGESGGRNARPMHPEWAREIREAVLDARIGAVARGGSSPALHFKQQGSWAPGRELDEIVTYDGRLLSTNDLSTFALPRGAVWMRYAGANGKSGGKTLDGVDWCEFPTSALTLA